MVGRGPRRRDLTDKPPGAAHEGRRRPRVRRAEECKQKDPEVFQRAADVLRTHRKKQAEEKLRATDYEDSGLVFAAVKGTPIDAQNIVNRYFKPTLLKRAELPDIRWHDPRHTYVTLLGQAPKIL